MELNNLTLEKKVLRCIFFHKDLLIRVVNRGRNFPDEVFSDKSIRAVYKILMKFFHKNGNIISKDLLVSIVNRYEFKSKDSELFRDKVLSIIDIVLSKKPGENTVSNFDVYINELIELLNGRLMQDYVMNLAHTIDERKFEDAKSLISLFKLVDQDEGLDQGEFSDDFEDRERIVKDKLNNPDIYRLYETGIKDLDIALDGGVEKEFIVISGSSNDGKSLLMQQIAANGYRRGRNVVLVEIGEMDKTQTQNRIDCNLAGIDYRFFRNPIEHYSIELHKKWKSKILKCKKKCGRLQVIGFRKSATVSDVLKKVYEVMNVWGVPLDALFIDSIDNEQTEKGIAKDWMGYEQICWDLFTITKSFRNLNGIYGIPLFGSTQLKKSSKPVSSDKNSKTMLTEFDVGSSPFQYRYSEVFVGMRNIEPGIRSELQIMK